jgi:hypothetical protein
MTRDIDTTDDMDLKIGTIGFLIELVSAREELGYPELVPAEVCE